MDRITPELDTDPDGGPSPGGLARALRCATLRCASGVDRMTVLYSGGLDSSLVAHLLKLIVPVQLVVIGTEGSRDPVAARAGAALLGLPLQEFRVTVADLEGAERRFPQEFDGLREPWRSVDLALAVALAHAPGPRIAVGQGADELFYGYAHFRGLSDDAARRRAAQDWALLERQEWPRAGRFAAGFGLELVSPFLDEEVVESGRSLDPPRPDEAPKASLRAAARELGLPEDLVRAPKRALQYGSGVHRLLARSVGRPPTGAGT